MTDFKEIELEFERLKEETEKLFWIASNMSAAKVERVFKLRPELEEFDVEQHILTSGQVIAWISKYLMERFAENFRSLWGRERVQRAGLNILLSRADIGHLIDPDAEEKYKGEDYYK